MKVDLDKIDIISLLKGTTPSFSVLKNIPEDLGRYYGGFEERWVWSISEHTQYSEEFLYDLYLTIKNS